MESNELIISEENKQHLEESLHQLLDSESVGDVRDKDLVVSQKANEVDNGESQKSIDKDNAAEGKYSVDQQIDYSDRESILETLYSDRSNFTIVALTGYTGSGCSRLADIMSKPFNLWPDVRQANDLNVPYPDCVDNEELMYSGKTNHKSVAAAIFARKYAISHNFASVYYKPYEVIKYSSVLVFIALRVIVDTIREEKASKPRLVEGERFKELWMDVLKDKFRPSKEARDDDYRQCLSKKDNSDFNSASEGHGYYPWEGVQTLSDFTFDSWDSLYILFAGHKDRVRKSFFDEDKEFRLFLKAFCEYIWKNDPYCTGFFFHRLGYVLRAAGNPLVRCREISKSNCSGGEYFFIVVEEINKLIKERRRPLKEGDPKSECRIVIDKIRNSLEAKYLKERYSAFYFVAVHEDNDFAEHLKNRITEKYKSHKDIGHDAALIDLQIEKILFLDKEERDGKQFENGEFFAPNTSQCVADAEIHMSNAAGSGKESTYFYSLSEQWMKYASLILHPGLITPSSEERCMVVAYTAKFNSGCLSRQVGAVITNKAHTIRSIGWNDVPYGQIPCSLRELEVMAYPKYDALRIRNRIYSEYERGRAIKYPKPKRFDEFVKEQFKDLHLIGVDGDDDHSLMRGLPNSYCFKTLQNDYEEVKNQVHTRSLHAEENAILQMAKYGGEGLHEGIIYVTASPCELCCKKLYQIGVRKIIYIDEYPGISRENIIRNGYHQPRLKQFQGAYGSTYFKLYQPFIAYKDELKFRRSK